MIDTAGVYHPFLDMCCYCEMDTGGNHSPSCFRCNEVKGRWLTERQMLKIARRYLGGDANEKG